jgi:AraC-like DNA-binding protein
LERMMREEKIYKDHTISKDKVSELLGTNRTYLSRIINEQAQLSFTHYVNRFRIEESIRILSDSGNDIPLKALASELGFNSISTFYNLFQASVGMTPAQYRSKVKELEKTR